MSSQEINIRLFASDLDGTLLGNPESTTRFRQAWMDIPEKRRPVLVFCTGRLVSDVLDILEPEHLPTPDYIIGGVGTQIWDVQAGQPLREFEELLEQKWDLDLVEQITCETPGIVRQPPEFLHPYKSSWYLHGATEEVLESLSRRLNEAGIEANLIYSSGRDLDVLPANADKGKALEWLCARLNIPLGEVLVAGDTGNDSSMFLLPEVHGIMVENAQPELIEAVVHLPVYASTDIMADGVLRGLRYFGLIDELPELRSEGTEPTDPRWRAMFDEAALAVLSPEEADLVAEGYEQALEALRKCVNPAGFLAAALEENEVTGTDENYRSIWARDGCVTAINVLFLRQGWVRETVRNTLATLLDHQSPNGQIPSNVRFDTLEPDYSGVGGIASIDSGLWLVIAVYHYVRATGDTGFLEHYSGRLQRAMDWLSAHDSNNDGLLEIPEAGDWTDLFGRSYNILYDEVLWFRANISYGRLLSFMGRNRQAVDYFRWSRHIRQRVLHVFWPSTRPVPGMPAASFADRQFSLGDSQYLLAQVSPFGFDWRCDVFGNILAFLTNLLDVERAKRAFRFMWGVGVNDPFPVANLYPPVLSGDPEWKPYYTVNLLNLPGHYHNGGIWPFIGGMWVRFIFRLGLRDVACHELAKLAQINKAGTVSAWEFNEWAHARTGRPMGKRFQAWSAATYLRACHELQLKPDLSNSE